MVQDRTSTAGRVKVRDDVVSESTFGNKARLSTSRSQRLFGVFTRRERWGLSWRGWTILLSFGSVLTVFIVLNVQPFLAQTRRVDSKILVVEGWMHDYAIRAAVDEFHQRSYERIFTTGGPVPGAGHYVNDYQTSASVAAELLKKAGIPEEQVQMVPSSAVERDRTYTAAIALREWFNRQEPAISSVNVITEDTHARRTRLLYQEALGRDITVGIIAVPNPDYDARHWWRYSEGVREVTSEAISYLYAKFFFYPPKSNGS
jgi:uncharacterized SAM-binding protein YcdF (DUF218 family)